MSYCPQESSQIPPAEAGPSWGAQPELPSKPACSQAKQLKGQRFGAFVFLFPFHFLPSLFKTAACLRVCVRYDADTPVLSVGTSPPLTHDGSQISTFCRKGGGGAVAAARKRERAC